MEPHRNYWLQLISDVLVNSKAFEELWFLCSLLEAGCQVIIPLCNLCGYIIIDFGNIFLQVLCDLFDDLFCFLLLLYLADFYSFLVVVDPSKRKVYVAFLPVDLENLADHLFSFDDKIPDVSDPSGRNLRDMDKPCLSILIKLCKDRVVMDISDGTKNESIFFREALSLQEHLLKYLENPCLDLRLAPERRRKHLAADQAFDDCCRFSENGLLILAFGAS